jgi:Uncharacterised nucleotidyltransferase
MSSPVSSPANPGAQLARRGFPSDAEFRLLLASSVVGNGREASQNLRSCLDGPLDWQRVLRLAESHSVTPLAYQTLRQVPDSVPPAILDELRRRYENNARRNLRFAAELIRILDCLESHRIDAIPYKGPVLAEAIYGDLALREFSDLDILVRAEHVLRAKEALKTLGFAPNLQLSPDEERAYLRTGYEYSFDGPAGRNLLEIQWGVVPRFYAVDFTIERFFERASLAEFSGRKVKTLSSEDLLLSLCVHAAKHAWIRLCWLRDIAAVMELPQMKWGLVAERAAALGVERIAGVSLTLAQRWLGANLPDPLGEKWSGNRTVIALCERIAQHLPEADEYSTESGKYFELMLRLRERNADKARFAWRLAFTPSVGEWSLVRLPATLFPLYRVIRMGRLAGRLFSARSGS